MKISQKGIDLIKSFEGYVLKVYLDPVLIPTCGYGHTAGLTAAMVGQPITQAQADAFLKQDLEKFEAAVNSLGLDLNQNQFDALVSFAYNCGAGNLRNLVKGRSMQQIADTMLAYNKAKGKVLAGLVRRRQEERALFLSGIDQDINRNPYPEPSKLVKFGSKGNDVRWLQYALNKKGDYHLVIDGRAGELTIKALRDFQMRAFPDDPNEWDGICGSKTRARLKK